MRKIAIPIALFLISLFVFTYQSDIVGLEFKGDESFYFQSARQMVASGDWMTPYYFDTPRFQKPILYYWPVAFSFKIFGVNWPAARLASAVSMALVVMLTFFLAGRFFDEKTGLLSALIMVTTIATFRYARLVLPETFFLLLLFLSLYLMLKRSYLAAYVCMGLLILTKGPVGFILPVFIMAAYKYGIGEKGYLKRIGLGRGVVIALAISLPWFLFMVKTHGRPYIDHVFFRETVQRINGFDLKRLFYYAPVVFIFFLPWSVLIINSIRKAAVDISKNAKSKDGAVFTLIWLLGVVIFFTFFGEKHRHYALFAAPPFAIISARYLLDFSARRGIKAASALLTVLILSFLVFQVAIFTMSEEIGGIGALFEGRDYQIAASDTVAIGSHALIPQDLEIYANHPVEKYGYKLRTQEKTDRRNAAWLNRKLFGTGKTAYLLIRKREFDKYITDRTKKGLTILAKGYMYSKGTGPDEVLKAIKSPSKESLLDLFREEVYFLTNKEGI
jgi:4-amino-4-deoxy-L-arabinose transferase-like glycosyltransferase